MESAKTRRELIAEKFHIGKTGRDLVGWYKSAGGVELNADINGAANIYRKVFPMEVIPEGVGAVVVQPVRLGEGPRVHEKAGLS